MSDWHSRLYGFLQRYMDEAMTTVELKTKVSVRCTHDFIESYQDLGNAAPHRTKDKIQNPHLLYGCIWNRIMQPLEEEVVRLVGSNKWTVFSSVVYALNETEIDSDEWNWPDIYMNRGPAGRLANLLAGDSVFSHFNKNHTHFEDMFASAIRYWHEMVVELQQKAGVMNISKIRSSAGLFGFIVVSHMRGSLPTRPKTASSRILARISDMSRICPELCRGDKVDIIKYCRQLKKVLY